MTTYGGCAELGAAWLVEYAFCRRLTFNPTEIIVLVFLAGHLGGLWCTFRSSVNGGWLLPHHHEYIVFNSFYLDLLKSDAPFV